MTSQILLYAKPCRRAMGDFRKIRNLVVARRETSAKCETLSPRVGRLPQNSEPCRRASGDFRKMRNLVVARRETSAKCGTLWNNKL